MRIGEGTIEEIKEDGLAKIKVSRDFLYVACSACAGAEHVMITAYNGTEPGKETASVMKWMIRIWL